MPNPDLSSTAALEGFQRIDVDCTTVAPFSVDGTFTRLLHRLAAEHAREVQNLRAQLLLVRSGSPHTPKGNGQVNDPSSSSYSAFSHHTRKESPLSLPLPVGMNAPSDAPDDACDGVEPDELNEYISVESQRTGRRQVTQMTVSTEGRISSATNATAQRKLVALPSGEVTEIFVPRPSNESGVLGTNGQFDGTASFTTSATGRASRVVKQVDGILLGNHDPSSSSFASSGARRKSDSPVMETIVSFIIILNIIQMGLSSDSSPNWKGWLVIDAVFAVFFLVEMLTKLWLTGFRYHFTPMGELWLWNWFDCLIVIMAFVDVGVALAMEDEKDKGESGGDFNMSLLRTVRLLRLARLTRLLRAPIFKELRMMFMGLFLGARTLFWSFLLVITPLYPVAIILRETLGNSGMGDELKREFESVTNSWFTIFRCVMGDCSDETGKPIFLQVARQEGWVYAVFYITVVITTVFGLFNVVTAIYVENIVTAAKQNDYVARRRRLQDNALKASLTKKLVLQFTQTAQRSPTSKSPDRLERRPTDLVGVTITEEMFEEAMKNEKVQELLDRMDIAEEDRLDLFEILDADGSGGLEVSELVNGILKLRGGARRSDVVSCRLLLFHLQDSMEAVMNRLNVLLPSSASNLSSVFEDPQERSMTALNSSSSPAMNSSMSDKSPAQKYHYLEIPKLRTLKSADLARRASS